MPIVGRRVLVVWDAHCRRRDRPTANSRHRQRRGAGRIWIVRRVGTQIGQMLQKYSANLERRQRVTVDVDVIRRDDDLRRDVVQMGADVVNDAVAVTRKSTHDAALWQRARRCCDTASMARCAPTA